MNCEEIEKVSALIDGELLDEEAFEMRSHIETCKACASAESDFLFMRQQIKGLTIDEQTSAPVSRSFFVRRLSIPAPVFAIALLVAAALAATLTAFLPGIAEESAEIERPAVKEFSKSSLARFDGGGKAQIYKEARR